MGNYATNQNLIDRFESSDAVAHVTNNPGGDPDQVVLTEALDAAEAFMESYISMRYDVPVDTTGEARIAGLLKGFALDLATYNLLTSGGSGLVPDANQKKYDQALRWLEAISMGKAVLPGLEGPPESTPSRTPRVKSSFDDRQFTRSNVSGL